MYKEPQSQFSDQSGNVPRGRMYGPKHNCMSGFTLALLTSFFAGSGLGKVESNKADKLGHFETSIVDPTTAAESSYDSIGNNSFITNPSKLRVSSRSYGNQVVTKRMYKNGQEQCFLTPSGKLKCRNRRDSEGGYGGGGGGGGYSGSFATGIGAEGGLDQSVAAAAVGAAATSYGSPMMSYITPMASYGAPMVGGGGGGGGWGGGGGGGGWGGGGEEEEGGGGGGGGGLGELKSLLGLLGLLGLKGTKGLLGLKGLIPLLPLILPFILPFLLPFLLGKLLLALLPLLLLLFIPVPVIGGRRRRTRNNEISSSITTFESIQDITRNVLTSQECIERISCEIGNAAPGFKSAAAKFLAFLPDQDRLIKAFSTTTTTTTRMEDNSPQLCNFKCSPSEVISDYFEALSNATSIANNDNKD